MTTGPLTTMPRLRPQSSRADTPSDQPVSTTRETRDAQKALAKNAAQQAVKDRKAAEAAAKAAIPPPPTDAERKAARDARYAARKARK